jgi:hypothetical protein
MAVCPHCSGEMKEEISCRPDPITIGDAAYQPVRWGDEWESKKWPGDIDFPCRDCGTPPGGVHHPGCCVERCPACLSQAITCGCFADPDEEDWDDDPVSLVDRIGHRGRRKDRCTAHRQPQHYRT